jgi:hypothetical protein
MCSKTRRLSQKCNTALHAPLHAVLHTALHAFSMSFSLSKLFFDPSTQKRTQCCVQRDVAFVQRNVALQRLAAMFAAFSVIGRTFCCTSKTQVNAADGLLYIQTARSKRKCNRPLSVFDGVFLHHQSHVNNTLDIYSLKRPSQQFLKSHIYTTKSCVYLSCFVFA